ncbi:MAG TPA: hypothetical protein PLU80_16510, partial [Acidobacteriota bacterium]|nr:hypothetical protein [Acidobacteriota bacterium]
HQIMVGNRAFPGQSLQFVLDYAWFLHTRNLLDQELKVLLTPVSRLDFDHNPIWQYQRSRLVQPVSSAASPQSNNQPPPALFESRCGVTQREFFRLLLEQIQQLKQIPALEQHLNHDLKLGNPCVLLLLAELRSAQEQPEAALKLELDYLKTLALDQPSRLFREALVFEQYGELKAAIERYSALPGITEVTITLPDVLELDSSVWITKLFQPTFVKNQFQIAKSQLADHMTTLYLMEGDVRKSSTALFQKQARTAVSTSVKELLELRETALASSSQTEFEVVEGKTLSRFSFDQQADYAWAIGNWSKAITIQSQYFQRINLPQNWWVPQDWEERITQLDPALQIKCYELLIEQFPKNAFLRLELLCLKNQLQSEAAIPYLEQLLDETKFPFPYWSTKKNTGLGGYPEVIRLLMSHYVAQCQKEKIFNLALRLARCDPPFKDLVPFLQNKRYSRFENSPMWIETHNVLNLAFDHIT